MNVQNAWLIVGRKGIIQIWLVFEILGIVENFIRITYTLYVDLIETLNLQLMYNFSSAER
jgi:hypothetical protein